MRHLLLLASVCALALWTAPAFADACVDVDLGATVVTHDPHDLLSLYFFAENCGPSSAVAAFTISLEKDLAPLGSIRLLALIPGGVSFTHTFTLPVSQRVPAGTYTLCIDAVIRDATDHACVSVEIDAANNVIRVVPIAPVATRESSWSAIKSIYR
jgi:hypothetical protein